MSKAIRDLEVEILPISALKPYARNAHTHSEKQIGQIAASIRAFGWTNPLLIDAAGEIIAGHGRLEAAKLLGLEEVPTIRLEDMTEAQKRAYVLADNRLAEKAGWDRELLAIELQGLMELDLDFEITTTGFEMAEIDLIIGHGDTSVDAADAITEEDFEGLSVATKGSLWRLGRHRLLCGDALDAADYARLMDGEKAEVVFTDPPYNVPIAGHVSGLGRRRHGDFVMGCGEMDRRQFMGFLRTAFTCCARNAIDGSIHYVCMDWRHLAETLAAGEAAYTELKNVCIWAKSNGGMGSFYRSAHELVLVFKSGKAAHSNNVSLGVHGRNRTNVWTYAGVNSFGAGRDDALKMHPTIKPVALIADAILDCSRRKGIVLDPFAGSGSTIIAAEQTGRKARAMELDPVYVDVALRRFHRLTGIEPINMETGLTLSAATEGTP